MRVTHFRAAVDTQRVTAEPNEHISGPSRRYAGGTLGKKGRLKNLSSLISIRLNQQVLWFGLTPGKAEFAPTVTHI